MKKNHLLLSRSFLAVILISCLCIEANSQVFSKFGIKGGLILSKLTFNNNIPAEFVKEPLNKYACLKTDFALYAEIFNSSNFCTSVELHYLSKGEDSKTPLEVNYLENENGYYVYNFRYINDRFQYISLQLLPKWKFYVREDDNMFFFGGPSFSYRLSNSSAKSTNAIELSNSRLMLGFKTGYGIELWDLFLLELSFSHDFTNAYVITYRDSKLNRKQDSFELLAGFNISKFFKKSPEVKF